VIEDLQHVLASRKKFGVRRIVSLLGGADNMGEPDALYLKAP